MALKIYDTLSKKKVPFKPIENNKVRMYVCGPTVYDFLHIGNFRGAIFFNLVRNWLEHLNYQVTYVYNYTDIDDKIINKAQKESSSTKEVAEKYIREFEKDYQSLGLRPHTHNPRATDHIEGMISMIQKLIEKNRAYVVNNEVFYCIKNFLEYGKLSGKNLEELQVGARVEVNDQKRDPLDFTLWKPSAQDMPGWDSPWGRGRPGWHIECSVMSSKLLGETIDIHGGGMDLIFPHHENEIAQSEGASEKIFVKYWMHHHLIQFGSEKMSKSLGNIISTCDFLQNHHPEILKYMMLISHYRSPSLFSEDQIQNAIMGLTRIYSALSSAHKIQNTPSQMPPKQFKALIDTAQDKITAALNDDFNTPQMFAHIFEVIRVFNALLKDQSEDISQIAKAFQNFIKKQGSLLALFQEDPDIFLRQLEDISLTKQNLKREDIDRMIKERNEARLNRDYQKSDKIRDTLLQKGIEIQDIKKEFSKKDNKQVSETIWTIKKYKTD